MNRAALLREMRATIVPETSPGPSLADWVAEGRKRAKDDSWWWADWWVRGEPYGDAARAQIVQADDWDGPSYATLRNYGVVAAAFPTVSHRCDSLSFSHHLELTSVREAAERKRLMNWAVKEGASRRALHAEIMRRRSPDQAPEQSPGPSPEPTPATRQYNITVEKAPAPPVVEYYLAYDPREVAQQVAKTWLSALRKFKRDPALWDAFVTELVAAIEQ
jgi:hypothetical protein